jgi:D-alanyl-D-alanine carboxypeptidase
MTRTTFKNAHGLTEPGHLSTARDMTTLGRHLLYDYPEYYNLFSRQSTYAGIKTVPNTNRRLLAAYKGADGIKTGYTRAAGFNLVASAKRGNERIIATVFGGKSSAWRNAKVAELLDLGFRRAPSRAPIRKPARPAYAGNAGLGGTQVARAIGAPQQSLRPVMRPGAGVAVQVASAVAETAAKNAPLIQDSIAEAIAAAQTTPTAPPVETADTRPALRPENLVLASTEPAAAEPEQEIVTRLSTSGGHLWGVNVGRFATRYEAEKVLLKTALSEMTTLEGSLRKVNQSSKGFEATFQGMTREQADLACRRLKARNVTCFMIGPS